MLLDYFFSQKLYFWLVFFSSADPYALDPKKLKKKMWHPNIFLDTYLRKSGLALVRVQFGKIEPEIWLCEKGVSLDTPNQVLFPAHLRLVP